MDFSEDSSLFLGYQSDAGEQSLISQQCPQALGVCALLQVPERRPRFFGLKLLGRRNGGAYRKMVREIH